MRGKAQAKTVGIKKNLRLSAHSITGVESVSMSESKRENHRLNIGRSTLACCTLK